MKWPVKLLGDVGDFRAGFGFPNSFQGKKSGDYPFAKVGDISTVARAGEKYISAAGNYLDEHELKTVKARPVPVGTIVFAKIGEAISQNFRAITAVEMLIDNNAMGLVPDPQMVDLDYLYHFMCGLDLYRYAGATTVPSLRKSVLEGIEIPLPPLPEQKRIAAILDKADAIRRKRQQAIQLADDFLRAVFLDMFGDPVSNPKGWELLPFSTVGTLDRGKSRHRPRNDPALLGGAHPLIQTGEVANSRGYIKEYSATYSDLGLAQSKKWDAGTLCITIAANIAKTGILTFPACFPDSVVGFIPNKHVTVEYVQHWLGFLQKNLEENAPQAAQKNINLEILRGLLIPVPPKSEQEKFSSIVAGILAVEGKIANSGNALGNAFYALSQKAFSGKL